MAVIVSCPKHPRYKAQRRPAATGCGCCKRLWALVAGIREAWPQYKLQFVRKITPHA